MVLCTTYTSCKTARKWTCLSQHNWRKTQGMKGGSIVFVKECKEKAKVRRGIRFRVWICLWYRYNRWENALANLFFLPPLICITNSFYNFLGTDWYFILHSTEGIYCTSKTEYRISLTEDAIKNPTELRKNVKRVLEVIVCLLKDRVSASEEPANKKRRVEEIIKKK